MNATPTHEYERLQALNAELCDALREACAQIDRLSAELERSEQRVSSESQAKEQALRLSRDLAEQLQAFKALSWDRLSARVDHVERLVMGIFEGRIWRTLTFLASPLKAVSLVRSKVSS